MPQAGLRTVLEHIVVPFDVVGRMCSLGARRAVLVRPLVLELLNESVACEDSSTLPIWSGANEDHDVFDVTRLDAESGEVIKQRALSLPRVRLV